MARARAIADAHALTGEGALTSQGAFTREAGAYTRSRSSSIEQLQDTCRVKMSYTVDRRAQVELKSERV
jgi:hypothetical protein